MSSPKTNIESETNPSPLQISDGCSKFVEEEVVVGGTLDGTLPVEKSTREGGFDNRSEPEEASANSGEEDEG